MKHTLFTWATEYCFSYSVMQKLDVLGHGEYVNVAGMYIYTFKTTYTYSSDTILPVNSIAPYIIRLFNMCLSTNFSTINLLMNNNDSEYTLRFRKLLRMCFQCYYTKDIRKHINEINLTTICVVLYCVHSYFHSVIYFCYVRNMSNMLNSCFNIFWPTDKHEHIVL